MGDIHEANIVANIKASDVKWIQINPTQPDEIKELDTAKALLRTDIDIILGAGILACFLASFIVLLLLIKINL